MSRYRRPRSAPSLTSGFLRSRAGLALIVFLVVAGLFLGLEHRAHILTGTGIVILLLVLCIGMHLFMHRGHGGSGKEGDR